MDYEVKFLEHLRVLQHFLFMCVHTLLSCFNFACFMVNVGSQKVGAGQQEKRADNHIQEGTQERKKKRK